ncbi:MAG: hypothetical protein J0626_10765 [Rhodospirillaceae bacterium]|nr:hypothetical protein [Rhodospirillaceae bacterium]
MSSRQNILNMADSFVDNVLHSACRNAKERGSKVLEGDAGQGRALKQDLAMRLCFWGRR